jgi:hypothetical protein
MSTSMTEKQRVAFEALQFAQAEGKTLAEYAKSSASRSMLILGLTVPGAGFLSTVVLRAMR